MQKEVGIMNKQELIAYLDAVCDAESAVQACEDAISLHKSQQNALYYPLGTDAQYLF